MHFVLAQQGTAGDIYPYLSVGVELLRRGHRVSFISNTAFGPLIRRHGLNFLDLEDEEIHRVIHRPEYWDPVNGRDYSGGLLTGAMRKQYELVGGQYEPGQTVAVASVNGLGARIAHEKLGLPFVSMHTCPWMVRSVARPSDMPHINLMPLFRYEPTGLARWIYLWCADRFFFDKLYKSHVNGLRAELGLAPVSRIMHHWIQSPDLIVGLFPKWYVTPYPKDWPACMRPTQFPLNDNRETEELAPSVRQFLEAGSPPIVFCPGTAPSHLHHFFATAVEACRRLGRRGLLLTRFPEQLPAKLPGFMHHESYVPFGQVLSRSAAFVCHGGMGSIAQALASGVPQLIMPLNYDQPDNARRLREFGVGSSIRPKKFHPRRVARHLDYLISSPSVRENCQKLKALFPTGNPVKGIGDLLEEFAERVAVKGQSARQVSSTP